MAKKQKKTFAGLVREHRTGLGLSYREAEVDSGVDKASICRVERGIVPTLPNFAKIVRWIGADPAKLLSEFST